VKDKRLGRESLRRLNWRQIRADDFSFRILVGKIAIKGEYTSETPTARSLHGPDTYEALAELT
jgi:hypothetical protein